MARPRADDYDEKRKAILKESAELFAEHGFDRASMNQIALACGVSKALVYHYYANKDALLFDIIRDHLDDLIASVEEAGEACDAGEARLLAYVNALLDAYRDANAEHKIQINEMKRLPEDQQEELKGRERVLVKHFAARPVRSRADPGRRIAAAHAGHHEPLRHGQLALSLVPRGRCRFARGICENCHEAHSRRRAQPGEVGAAHGGAHMP